MKRTERIGIAGEKLVEAELEKLDESKYYVFCDLMLRHNNGKTAQIDFAVICCYGVFLIEVKNYKGIICQSEYKSYIKQITKNGEFIYPNPLNQNKWHSVVVAELLGGYEGIEPIVVFCGADSVSLPDENCVSLNRLLSYIHSFDSPLFTTTQVVGMVRAIAQNNVYEKTEREKHLVVKKHN